MQQESIDNVTEVAAQIAGKADQIKKILVIYETDTGMSVIDNGLEVSEANFIIDAFKFWLLHCMVVKK